MSFLGGLDNESERIVYLYLNPLVGVVGVLSNVYFITFTPYLEEIYPTGMGYVRFLNIVDLAIALWSFVWPWLYNLGKAYSLPYSTNLYWLIYMAYFHPVFRSTWSKTVAFLLPVFATERFISVVMRNKFTLLRNIEFVKFTALMCLAIGLFLSMPRITWYKVTYMSWFPDPPRLVGNTVRSNNWVDESTMVLSHGSTYRPRTETELNEALRLAFVMAEEALVNGAFASFGKSQVQDEEKRIPKTLYFRENNMNGKFRKSSIFENATMIISYLIALGFTIVNLIYLLRRNRELRGSYKASGGRIVLPKDRSSLHRLHIPQTHVTHGHVTLGGSGGDYDTCIQSNASFDVVRYFGHHASTEESVSNPRSTKSYRSFLEIGSWFKRRFSRTPASSVKRARRKPSYAVLVVPEREIVLLRLQVWSTLFKFVCIFPGPIMTLLYPYFQKNHSYFLTEEEEDGGKTYDRALPYINFLEYFNVAVTPLIMIFLLPEMRSITKSGFRKLRRRLLRSDVMDD